MGPLRPLRGRRRPTHRAGRRARPRPPRPRSASGTTASVAELSRRRARARRSTERERIESIFTRAIYYAHLLVLDGHDRLAARRARRAAHGEGRRARHAAAVLRARARRARGRAAPTRCSPSAALEHWRHWLRPLRKFRPYVLTEPEEKILTEKSVSGVSAWDRLYDELLGAIKRRSRRRRRSASRRRWRSSTRPIATCGGAPSEAVTVALEPGLRTRTYVFNTIVVDKSIDDRLRGYATWISARNLVERHDRRGRPGADRRGRRPLRRRPALLHAQGAAARARPARVLRPHGAARGRLDARRGAMRASSSSDAFADFSTETGDIVERFFGESWIDAPPRDRTSGPARSARRTSPACTRTSS